MDMLHGCSAPLETSTPQSEARSLKGVSQKKRDNSTHTSLKASSGLQSLSTLILGYNSASWRLGFFVGYLQGAHCKYVRRTEGPGLGLTYHGLVVP